MSAYKVQSSIVRFLSQPIGEKKKFNIKSISVVIILGLLHEVESERKCSLGYKCSH